MDQAEHARETIAELLASQVQAVLATQQERQPYTSLMAFTVTPDLKRLIFATYRATHKYANLMANARAAMLIDNRTCRISDHYEAIAVTAVGVTREVADADRAALLDAYLAKQPNLADFVHSPACALMELEVESYYLVSRFQDVIELRP